jgi:hypothetical protein
VPVVIDSDELLDNVEAGMKAYCDAMKREADKAKISNPTWNADDHGFHDSL